MLNRKVIATRKDRLRRNEHSLSRKVKTPEWGWGMQQGKRQSSKHWIREGRGQCT
jgi:hypothetical protein